MEAMEHRRVDEIRNAVRQAVAQLRGLERRIIEEYYFDGLSMGRVAEAEGVSHNRVVTTHRQAIRNLREMLAPFVARTFGIGATIVSTCPICTASWRGDADSIIDGKTPDMTWGQIVIRINRSTGWRARSPQVLIVHKRKHNTFQTERDTHDQAESAWGARIEDQHLDGLEDEPGEAGEVDGSPFGGCMPDASLDGVADFGGIG